MSAKTKFDSATEETGSTPVTNDATQQGAAKEQPREFLKVGRKILNEEELSSPAARRFMIAEIERLDSECIALREISQKYVDLRVSYATLNEASKRSRWIEILSFVSLSAGSAGLGAAPNYLAIQGVHQIGWTFVVASGILVAVGIVSSVFR